jgi:type IV secretory pathway VirB10-like protein
MVNAYYDEDGDPHGPEERRRRPRRVRPWVWGVLGLGTLGVLVVLATTWGQWQGSSIPLIDQKTDLLVNGPQWTSYTEQLKEAQAVQRVAFEKDLRMDELQRKLAAMEQAEAEQNKLLQQLLNRKETEQKAAEAQKAPLKPKRHRDMGHMAFELPKDTSKDAPLYELLPGHTKIPCTEETQANSDVENGATVKVSTNVYDTATGHKLLIPQGSVVSQRYMSQGLVYGNQRLPMFSTLLSIRYSTGKGHVIDLEATPTLDEVGQAGLVTRINNHFWRAVPAILIQGVLRGSVEQVSGTNPYAAGVANSAAQYGNKVTQPWIDMRPTILVDPGAGCTIILTRTIELPEYKTKG